MAVFLSNICKFNSCGLKFASLPELIRHIEDHHIDLDSSENQSSYLPVSSVLRIFSSQSDDISSIDSTGLAHHHHHHGRKTINSPAASLSTTPTEGSELDEDAGFESDSGQSSIESCWNHPDSQTMSKFHQIMGSNATSSVSTIDIHNRLNGKSANKNDSEKKLYACNFNGCTKQYRTSNSLSHHRRNVHKSLGLMANVSSTALIKTPNKLEDGTKKYKCYCGKEYKTSHGLKSHINLHHNNNNNNNNSNQTNQNQLILSQAQNQNGEPMAIQANVLPDINQQSDQKNDHSFQQRFMQINQASLSAIVTKDNGIVVTDGNGISGSISRAKNNLKITTTGTGNIFNTAEIIPDQSCPPVSVNVEVTSEPKSSFFKNSPSIISAPTLQQHLLSPIIPKVNSS